MTLIRVDGGTFNKTDAKHKMHKSRRKILDVMDGNYTKDTFGYRETQEERGERLRREEEQGRAKRELDDAMKEFRMPWFCPKCKNYMGNKFDKKFWLRTGHCFTCQQDYEHKLRVSGLYPLWERIKIFQNEISILKEQRVKFAEALDSDMAVSQLVNSDGTITSFEFAGRWETIKQELKSEIEWIDETLPAAENELKRMIDELNEKDIENIVDQDSLGR